MDAVLFDLDDTLCRYRRHGAAVLAHAFEAAGVEPCFSIQDYYAIFDDHTGAGDTVDDQRESCFAALARDAGQPASAGRAVARAFAAERDHRNVDFLDGAAAALESLGARYPLGLVTNGAPGMQGQKIDALGIRDHFSVIVHGGYDTPPKPSPEPFDRALSVLEVSPDRAVHIGNSLESDVAGAAAADVGSVWLRNGEAAGSPAVQPDYTVDSLDEVAARPWVE